ncbi:MAG: hypothetical protein V3R25_10150 [Nitrosomonadaceae bacterium]
MSEEKVLDEFAKFAKENGGEVSAGLLSRLFVSLLQTTEVKAYEQIVNTPTGESVVSVTIN